MSYENSGMRISKGGWVTDRMKKELENRTKRFALSVIQLIGKLRRGITRSSRTTGDICRWWQNWQITSLENCKLEIFNNPHSAFHIPQFYV